MAITAKSDDTYLLSVLEVAKLLRVATSTVRSWIARDRIPYIELPGGDYRIPRAQLLRTLRGNVDVASVLDQIEAKLAKVSEDDIRAEVAGSREERRAGR